MNCTKDGSLKAVTSKRLFRLLSSGKYELPIKGQELKIFPASIPETKAPIEICKKIRIKNKKGIKVFSLFVIFFDTLILR